MSSKIELWVNDPIIQNENTKYSASIELPSGKIKELWYCLPSRYSSYVTDKANPYLQAILFWVMGSGYNIHVHGSVLSSLLQNLEDFQRTWVCWFPNKYKKIEIIVDKEYQLSRLPRSELICAFSGGVDSCFTAYRHRQGETNRRNVTAGLIIKGFEIPLEEDDQFRVSYERAKVLLESIGMEAIPMSSNAHQFSHDWMFDYMSSLSSSLSLLSEKFGGGLIGGSRINTTSTTIAFPWGSNAISDHLLSSSEFEIINDGGFYTRTQKINEIAKWDEAKKYLQVCWKDKINLGNCGHCEKCIVNVLNYRATLNAHPDCFPGEVTLQEIRNMNVEFITQIEDFIEILEEAYRNGLRETEWVRELENVLMSKPSMDIQMKWKENLLKEFKMKFVQEEIVPFYKEAI